MPAFTSTRRPSPMRLAGLFTAVLLGAAACSNPQEEAATAVEDMAEAMEQGRVPDAADLPAPELTDYDKKLAEFGWTGMGALLYAQAEQCDADPSVLETAKADLRDDLERNLGFSEAEFNADFQAALEVARDYVDASEEASLTGRAGGCQWLIDSIRNRAE